MVEKFSDYESSQYLSTEGTFDFEVTNASLQQSSTGGTMAVFDVKCEAGVSKLYFSLSTKARWKYNNFIKACMKFDNPAKYKELQLDYETYHRNLIGKHFIGTVVTDTYEKSIKVPQPDGTFADDVEIRVSYKIDKYTWVD